MSVWVRVHVNECAHCRKSFLHQAIETVCIFSKLPSLEMSLSQHHEQNKYLFLSASCRTVLRVTWVLVSLAILVKAKWRFIFHLASSLVEISLVSLLNIKCDVLKKKKNEIIALINFYLLSYKASLEKSTSLSPPYIFFSPSLFLFLLHTHTHTPLLSSLS